MLDKEQQQLQRELAQDRAEQLSMEHKHLLLEWATGVGKGRAVMRCINASKSKKKWLVICPEILQVENFKKDLEKHGFTHLLGKKIADVICYASFKNYVGTSYNLALNECHRLSELRYHIGNSIDFDQIVSDSATVPYDVRQRLEEISPVFEYKITLKQAIAQGILPKPKFHLIKVEISEEARRELRKMDNTYQMWKHKYSENRARWIGTKMNLIRGKSKQYIAALKTEKAKEIIASLQGKRMVCFTGSIEQCNDLGEEFAVHSKKNKKKNIEMLEKFNNFEIHKIILNRMGREGLNLNGIEATVITQLDSGNDEGLSFLQTTGRGMRGDAPEIYILYVDVEQDRDYLNRALRKIDKRYIVNYEQIGSTTGNSNNTRISI